MTHDMTACRASLNIAGQHYRCTQMTHMAEGSENHDGWGHSNEDADAIWVSDLDPVPGVTREHVVSDTEDCWCQPEIVKVAPA